MRCSHPIQIQDPNGKRGEYISVRCGYCTACRIEYQKNWKIRSELELKNHDYSMWIALTYDDLHLSLQNLEYEKDVKFSHLGRIGKKNSLEKDELVLFFKRFRKAIAPVKIRYMYCGEYGDKFGRPHYHVILFGLSPDHPIFKGFIYDRKRKGYVGHINAWPFGEFWYSEKPANLFNAEYLAKYIHKKHKGKDAERYYSDLNVNSEFFGCSNRPGIGAVKIDEFKDHYAKNPYVVVNGKKTSMPRYMKERLAKQIDDFKASLEWANAQILKKKSGQVFNGEQQERNLRHNVK